MGVRVLGLASGVTSREDHRHAESTPMQQSGPINARSGIIPTAGAADMATVSAMVASIAPFSAWIDGGSGAQQAGYNFVFDTLTNFTFADGEASVDRVDRIWAVVRDNTYDASGFTAGAVEYAKGQSSGLAQPLPPTALLLWEQTVIHGTTAGSGGINFATKVDKRVYTAGAGGLVPIASVTERAAIASPYNGMPIYRKDTGWVEIYDGAAWRVRSQAAVATFTDLAGKITDPWEGLQVYVKDVDLVYGYTGTAWARQGRGPQAQTTRAASVTSLPTSHTETDITGASLSLTTTKPNAVLMITASFDFSIGNAATQDVEGLCNVDTVDLVGKAEAQLTTTGQRGTYIGTWTTTIPTAKTFTVKLRGINNTAQTVNSNAETSMTTLLFD